MQRSSIQWTNFTSNPLQYRYLDGKIVWACIHASPGCFHCYAEQLALRYIRGKLFNVANMREVTPFVSEKEIHSILTYKPAKGKMCFLGDMTDIFGDWVSFDLIDKIFAAMAVRSDVTFQLLTKRAERMREYCTALNEYGVSRARSEISGINRISNTPWPLPNVWLGVSCEAQQYANERIPLLLLTPSVKRFVSYEPALGPIDLTALRPLPYSTPLIHGLDQVIVGAESGVGARPFDLSWARNIHRQCRAANIAFFFKQQGKRPIDHPDDNPNCDFFLNRKDSHGGDMEEWDAADRVREFPA